MVLATGLALAGCSKAPESETASAPATTETSSASAAASPAAEQIQVGLPTQSENVIEAKQAAKDGQNIVLVGRVKDFVEGASVLTLADESLEDCTRHAMDSCPTPWDYCCVAPDVVSSGTATVKLVNSAGEPMLTGLKGVKGIDHLVQLAAEGKVVRDETGNLIVEASRLYVKQ
jgi:hypothetical protein